MGGIDRESGIHYSTRAHTKITRHGRHILYTPPSSPGSNRYRGRIRKRANHHRIKSEPGQVSVSNRELLQKRRIRIRKQVTVIESIPTNYTKPLTRQSCLFHSKIEQVDLKPSFNAIVKIEKEETVGAPNPGNLKPGEHLQKKRRTKRRHIPKVPTTNIKELLEQRGIRKQITVEPISTFSAKPLPRQSRTLHSKVEQLDVKPTVNAKVKTEEDTVGAPNPGKLEPTKHSQKQRQTKRRRTPKIPQTNTKELLEQRRIRKQVTTINSISTCTNGKPTTRLSTGSPSKIEPHDQKPDVTSRIKTKVNKPTAPKRRTKISERKQFKCTYPKCNFKGHTELSVKCHLSQFHNLRLFSCHLCPRDYKYPKGLKRHLVINHSRRKKRSRARRTDKELLQQHGIQKQVIIKINPVQPPPPVQTKSEPKCAIQEPKTKSIECSKFKCCYKKCTFIGRTEQATKTHLGMAHNLRPFRCHICALDFRLVLCLKQHYLSKKHSKALKALLQLHGITQSIKINLAGIDHEVSCYKTRPFKCLVCTRRFTSKQGLNIHLRKACPGKVIEKSVSTQTKLRSCPYEHCNFRSYAAAVWYHKIKVHQKDNRFKCQLCSFTTKFNSSLRSHQRIVHKLKLPRLKTGKAGLNSKDRRIHSSDTAVAQIHPSNKFPRSRRRPRRQPEDYKSITTSSVHSNNNSEKPRLKRMRPKKIIKTTTMASSNSNLNSAEEFVRVDPEVENLWRERNIFRSPTLDLIDQDTYEIVARKIEPDGSVRYQVVWRKPLPLQESKAQVLDLDFDEQQQQQQQQQQIPPYYVKTGRRALFYFNIL